VPGSLIPVLFHFLSNKHEPRLVEKVKKALPMTGNPHQKSC